MRNLLFFVVFLFSINLFAQLKAPYYQSFDTEFNFWKESDQNKYVPNHDILMFSLERWERRKKKNYFDRFWVKTEDGTVKGNKKKKRDLKPQNEINWDNEPERLQFVRFPDRKGKSLKLITLDNYDNAGGITDDKRSRTEIKVKPKHGEGTDYYYAWSFLIPDNEEHEDSEVKDNIIAQWHEDVRDDWKLGKVSPPFFLTYKNDPTTKDNERELGIMYGERYEDKNEKSTGKYYSFRADEKIRKGEWTDVVMHIKWSTKNEEGFLELWINGKKVKHKGEDKFYSANIYEDKSGKVHPNYLKIGQYRLGQKNTQIIYLDDFRIGNTFDEVNTRLTFKNCSKDREKPTEIAGKLRVNKVYGAKGYQFYFPELDRMETSKKPYLKRIHRKKWLKKGRTYEVKARVNTFNKSDKKQGFGESCYIKRQ